IKTMESYQENIQPIGAEPLSKTRYFIGLFVIFAAASAQYFIEDLTPIEAGIIVYGIPLLFITLFFGQALIKNAFSRMKAAFKYGFAYFGLFSIATFILSILLLIVLLQLDPSALELLNKPNPMLDISPNLAWIMIIVSLLFVGPVEEYIFRGFVFGGLLTIFKNRHWLILAIISSNLFAAIHFYYAPLYEWASLVVFLNLFSIGLTLSVSYYLSGGNLFVPAFIHGLFDATSFLAIAISPTIGVIARMIMVAIGLFAALFIFRKRQNTKIIFSLPSNEG
ncbi:MAG: hypothetical protein A2174_01810, partial [Candidatus Portnoybacteria bacterium RBG_13_41_18]